ncbi:hypothetical protein G7Y79_00022g052800 [Physcia stellaris]|nr:hypothetical protein G7Y79_00022g052800 [Physcia stellaris]
MDDFEQYTLISSKSESAKHAPKYSDDAFGDFEALSDRSRVATVVPLSNNLRERHPNHRLTVIETRQCDLLGFAKAGKAFFDPDQKTGLTMRTYVPPVTKLDGAEGTLEADIVFAKVIFQWQDHEFIVYLSEGLKDGVFGLQHYTFVLHKTADSDNMDGSSVSDKLILEASKWTLELHNEIWIAQEASWENVILDEDMKATLREDVEGFFEDRAAYEKYAIPWKRGLIFYGPPGNGKTISIKAMMKTLSNRPQPVACLYVKSFSKFNAEYGIRRVFQKARETAPCLLIFEDVDSLVTPSSRSYFLNEIDGLEKNDGICMVGSTNHRMSSFVMVSGIKRTFIVDLLDPGLSKRPSRFDRKYLFPLPSLEQRVQYSEFWRHKLAKNDADIVFPREMSKSIADITHGFSFAYMKEAFVASLLRLITRKRIACGGGDGFEDLPLWREIKRQVSTLREELGEEVASKGENGCTAQEGS